MKKLLVYALLLVFPVIVAEESVQFELIMKERDNYLTNLEKSKERYPNDCKLVMLSTAINNMQWRMDQDNPEQYSEKAMALQGIDIILNWADKSYVRKFGQTWDMCEEQNRDLHRFVEDLYDNEEVNKEVIVIDQLKIYEAFNALTIDKSVKSNEEVNKE